eukprot:6191396-Pleurochrysis_carterae.AAC.1
MQCASTRSRSRVFGPSRGGVCVRARASVRLARARVLGVRVGSVRAHVAGAEVVLDHLLARRHLRERDEERGMCAGMCA